MGHPGSRGKSRSVRRGGAPQVPAELFELTDVIIRGRKKPVWGVDRGRSGGRPRPVGWVTAPGRVSDCARSGGRPRPVGWVTGPGHMVGPGWGCFSGLAFCKGLILLESGLGGKFFGSGKYSEGIRPGFGEVGLFCAGERSRPHSYILGCSHIGVCSSHDEAD